MPKMKIKGIVKLMKIRRSREFVWKNSGEIHFA